MAQHSTDNPWSTLSTREVYDNPWIRVTESAVLRPDGRDGIYGMVHFKNRAVGVVPLEEDGTTWLVGQYRYALGSYEWEIPQGGCPADESPLETARRELAEETGFAAGSWETLFEGVALSNSVTDEKATVFVARGLVPGAPAPEGTERLQLRRLPLAEALAMALSGEISDAVSALALFKLALTADPPHAGPADPRAPR